MTNKTRASVLISTIILLSLWLHPLTAAPQPAVAPLPDGSVKLTASDPGEDEYFGGAVALEGNTAVVSAPFDEEAGRQSGAVYVFVRNAGVWTQQAKLMPDDAGTGKVFGSSVSLSGDTLVVGALKDSTIVHAGGSAYVFTRSGDTWTQQAKLVASDTAEEDYFGQAVAVDGDTIVVGAYWKDDPAYESGAAYVFTRSGDTWTQQTRLTPSNAGVGTWFGYAVALDGDTALIGARGSSFTDVFVRDGDTWTQQAIFPGGGYSVALEGNTAVVDAYDDDSGAVYVYTRSGDTWTRQAILTPNTPAPDDHFGISVALDGDAIAVGSWFDDVGGQPTGSAYVFVRRGNTYPQLERIIAADAASGDYFGWGVALAGNTVLVGARRDDDGSEDSGSAYVYNRAMTLNDVDVNADSAVTPADAVYVANRVGTGDLSADVNGDGLITTADFDEIMEDMGKSVP